MVAFFFFSLEKGRMFQAIGPAVTALCSAPCFSWFIKIRLVRALQAEISGMAFKFWFDCRDFIISPKKKRSYIHLQRDLIVKPSAVMLKPSSIQTKLDLISTYIVCCTTLRIVFGSQRKFLFCYKAVVLEMSDKFLPEDQIRALC